MRTLTDEAFRAAMGKRIHEARIRKGMSESELALMIAVSPQMARTYEAGIRCPGVVILCRMARALHVTTDYLLGMEEKENAQ